jgi:acyl-CoA thioester hydrolase
MKMGRRYAGNTDDFIEFALYMLPRYIRRIERYKRRYDKIYIKKEKEFHHHKDKEDKKENFFLDEFVDKKMLMDIIKKNLFDQKDALSGEEKGSKKSKLSNKHNPDDTILKKGMEKADKILDKAIDNTMTADHDRSPKKDNGDSHKDPAKNDVPQHKDESKEENKNIMYTSSTRIKVRYAETDKMGIAHHSNYYIWFEAARGDFIKKAGITYKDIEDKGIMMPLVETYCKYSKAAKYDDDLIIEASIADFNPVKISFNYRVLNEKNSQLLAKGKTTQTFIDKKFKIVNLKKKYPELWDKLQLLR